MYANRLDKILNAADKSNDIENFLDCLMDLLKSSQHLKASVEITGASLFF